MKIDSLEKLFHEELKDIYDAEKRLTKALPKMAKAASSDELKSALNEHLEVTVTQVSRLEKVFELIGAKAVSKTCMAMKGLLEEGEEALQTDGPDPIPDLCIIGAGRRVEHYEMAAYETLTGIAKTLQLTEIEDLLAANLQEEIDADAALAELSMQLMESEGSGEEEEDEESEEQEPVGKMQPVSTKAGTRKVVNA